MNRVRIVAVTAVALGAAVVAGTRLQETRAAAEAPAVAHAPVAAEAPSLARLADPSTEAPVAAAGVRTSGILPAAPAPDGAPPRLQAASSAGPLGAASASDETAPLAGASVLPRMPMTDPIDPTAPAPARLAQSVLDPQPAPQPLDPQLQAELAACAVWLVATPAANAMLEASVYAPCDRGAPVTIAHGGVRVDGVIGQDGQMILLFPALAEQADVVLTFADGREQRDSTLVPDLAMIERVAIHWQGPATVALHAYENGASFGQPGHVHSGSLPRTDGVAQGFVTALGDPALGGGNQLQVYSFPRAQGAGAGQVTLEIEVPVTDASCGQPLSIQAIEVHGSAVQVRQITLDVPACDGTGGFVVLPGVLPDLQIAMN